MTEQTPSATFPPHDPAVRLAVIAEHLLATVAKHLAGGNAAFAAVFIRELESVVVKLSGELERL